MHNNHIRVLNVREQADPVCQCDHKVFLDVLILRKERSQELAI